MTICRMTTSSLKSLLSPAMYWAVSQMLYTSARSLDRSLTAAEATSSFERNPSIKTDLLLLLPLHLQSHRDQMQKLCLPPTQAN
ncbi:hypothetical protein EB796_012826 [Bugula neritina]|uniref:Uncharacterized protein n=1 Tax=Bugula neritina TaxID=10212 RepID=A0A7J7JT75_BUGNE|nr:hypothetical protein EB796_012826 [Bugula neritina]